MKIIHRCLKCSKLFPHSFTTFCDSCGGMIEVEYDISKVVLHGSGNTLERFIDLMPIEDNSMLLNQNMSYTPCFHAKKLGRFLRMPALFLKDETVLPTGSTKDRMAVVSLAYLKECGVRAFCTSSTGNSSTAYAHAIAHNPGLRMFLFTAESFRDRVQVQDSKQVVQFVIRDASFVEAFECAGKFAVRHNLVSERGFFNAGRREGLKLAFLEAAEQVPKPIDWYVQAVSSAMGVYGTYKGAKELLGLGRIPHLPRLFCVQQESCSPMVRAFRDGSEVICPEHIVHKPYGIAKAILRGNPTRVYPYVRDIVIESNGTFKSVCEQEIRDAKKMAEEFEGVSPCFSASTALAGLVRMVREKTFPINDTVLVNLTGRDRQSLSFSRKICWLKACETGWEPEDRDDEITRKLWDEPMSEIDK